MTSIARVMLSLAVAIGICAAQSPPKKAHIFHGKVEKVNAGAKTVTVNGEKVEGWMGAMTMDYKVDGASILNKVKAGDQISATVYDGDYSLHNVRVVTASDAKTN
ncbi:MAG: copper-binding protein [Bryobacterales bacterium]|nr:copper-binding protein [Bryobacterales bacterium]MBV9399955.1 copper-binding protein [Bryobacterales bacterium]